MPSKQGDKRPENDDNSGVYPGPKTPKSAGPLLASSKLSDYHILKVLQLFAEGVSAAKASRQVRVSYLTIQRIYDMTRLRLVMLGYYTLFENFIVAMDGREDLKGHWDKQHFLSYMDRKLRERKGVTGATLPLHRAELAYRYVNEEFEEPGTTPSSFAEIVRLVRISGPLNRPLDNDRAIRALEFALGRIEDSHRRSDREVRVMMDRLKKEKRRAKR